MSLLRSPNLSFSQVSVISSFSNFFAYLLRVVVPIWPKVSAESSSPADMAGKNGLWFSEALCPPLGQSEPTQKHIMAKHDPSVTLTTAKHYPSVTLTRILSTIMCNRIWIFKIKWAKVAPRAAQYAQRPCFAHLLRPLLLFLRIAAYIYIYV